MNRIRTRQAQGGTVSEDEWFKNHYKYQNGGSDAVKKIGYALDALSNKGSKTAREGKRKQLTRQWNAFGLSSASHKYVVSDWANPNAKIGSKGGTAK